MAPPSIAASSKVRDVAELTRGRVAEKERKDRIGSVLRRLPGMVDSILKHWSMDWFVGENLNRKPSIFPWRSWGFPVNFPLIQSILNWKKTHQKAMIFRTWFHWRMGENPSKNLWFSHNDSIFLGRSIQHFWWPPGLNGELMEWHSKKSMWAVEHALLGMKELVAHPV